jgi:hypothetical protein
VFNVWALGTMPVLLNRLLSIDGKSIKCTSSGGNTSRQNFTSLVSVYDDQAAGVVQLQIIHNQKEVERSVSVFAAPVELLTKWMGVNSVMMVDRTGIGDDTPFTETIYDLSSQSLPADTYMTLIRGHWAIENRLHWVKDVTFSEDYPPRLGDHAPVNWAIIFTWLVTLVRRAHIRTVPQALRLWANQVEEVFSFLV